MLNINYRWITKLLLTASLMVPASWAQATLLTNGSFENFYDSQTAPNTGRWRFYDGVPGWTGVNHVEIHGSPFLTTAQHGDYYAELNAHPRQDVSFQIYQDFATLTGKTYELTFWAQKRRGNDGSFSVAAGDLLSSISSHVTGTWTEYVYTFVAQADTTRLMFTSGQGGHDTVGHFLDNIAVKVPEPDSLALMLAGLLAVVLRQRRLH